MVPATAVEKSASFEVVVPSNVLLSTVPNTAPFNVVDVVAAPTVMFTVLVAPMLMSPVVPLVTLPPRRTTSPPLPLVDPPAPPSTTTLPPALVTAPCWPVTVNPLPVPELVGMTIVAAEPGAPSVRSVTPVTAPAAVTLMELPIFTLAVLAAPSSTSPSVPVPCDTPAFRMRCPPSALPELAAPAAIVRLPPSSSAALAALRTRLRATLSAEPTSMSPASVIRNCSKPAPIAPLL